MLHADAFRPVMRQSRVLGLQYVEFVLGYLFVLKCLPSLPWRLSYDETFAAIASTTPRNSFGIMIDSPTRFPPLEKKAPYNNDVSFRATIRLNTKSWFLLTC